jgi:hypothetical protein
MEWSRAARVGASVSPNVLSALRSVFFFAMVEWAGASDGIR